MRLQVKSALLGAATAVIPVAICSLVLLPALTREWRDVTTARRQESLRAAGSILEKRLAELRSATQRLADDVGLVAETESGSAAQQRARLQDLLARARDEYAFDFVIIADAKGKVTARSNDAPQPSEELLQGEHPNKVAEAAIANGSRKQLLISAAPAIEDEAFLKRMWLDKTAAVKSPNDAAKSGLMLEAAAPVVLSGSFAGIVLTGQMLNNYNLGKALQPGASSLQTPLIGEIKQALRPGSDEDWGAVIALRDVIVASSLQAGRGGEPLLKGSKHDPEAGDEALRVEDHAYSVLWQPIKSAKGERIGALGIASPSGDPATAPRMARNALLTVAIAAMFTGGLLGLLFGGSLSSRISRLTGAVNRMSLGELSVSINDRGSRTRSNDGLAISLDGDLDAAAFQEPDKVEISSDRDEIQRLAEQLDVMRESFRQAIERIRRR